MKVMFLVSVAAMMLSEVASAHHGYAGFYMDRTVTVEGAIEHVLLANPHVVMRIRAADSDIYTVTWQAARWVESVAGVTKTTFSVGDHVLITASPSRDPASHELVSVREIHRPSDGWRWRRAMLSTAPSK